MWRCPACHGRATFSASDRPWPPDWVCGVCGTSIICRDGIPRLAPELACNPTGFDPKLFSMLVEFEESSFWFVNRARLIITLMQRYFPNARAVLEIGCGTGSVLLAVRNHFPHFNLIGSELDPSGLVFARARLGNDVTLLQMDARQIPARAEFDLIGAFDIIEHVTEDEVVLAEIYHALKPGGGAIISVPQHRWLWSQVDDDASHKRRYAPGELESKAERAGFRVVMSTSFNALLMPFMLVSRLRMRLRGKRDAVEESPVELRLPMWLNRAMSTVLRVEVYLTSIGLRWPAGGSRVLVAQRPPDA
jgi:SAM-dependent methyltransferase